MRTLTIIGAGEGGINLVRFLREKNTELKILLVDKNDYYFDKSEFILDLTCNNKILISDFAKKMNIDFIKDKVLKINPKNRKIYFKEHETLEFDMLVIATGLVSKKLQIEGQYREGFFYLSDIDPFKVINLLKISNEATVYVSTILGLKLALGLKNIGKEVKIVFSNLDFLCDYKEKILDFLRQKNIDFYLNATIEEAIGEGTIKAVKISPLKIFSSQLLFVDSGFLSAKDLFEEEIKVKDNFFCDYEDIYFIGDVIRCQEDHFYLNNKEDAKLQAKLLSDFILGGNFPYFTTKQITFKEKEVAILSLLNS
ncbi:MAG: NAD(P)/FAD-dependent oxidoreductase [Candidatus Omnitrophica bacterium]|nr:NAD(P)/FAD-dependent oxidoreductase [Candidatus Omnitrophota bacterium]MCM8831336.1 NAD(P)/FAD-dependent oxidoreductase [Candidatus Omnitrophota bacterium]